MLSNLCLRLFAVACLMLPVSGCVPGSRMARALPDAHGSAHEADRRLVPPDLVWTLSDGARMPVRLWQPAGNPVPVRPVPVRAVVLALHGINDSRDAWELPGPVLAADGIAVYAPDQRGFGAAPGRGRWPDPDRLVNDAAEMVRLVAAAHPGTPVFVMGESMGGAVALCLAARPDHPPVAGFVLLAPAVWSSTQMSPLLTASLWTASTFLPDWKLTGRELPLQVRPSDNIAALYRLSYDPLTLKETRADSLRGLVGLMTRAAAAAPAVRDPMLIAYGAHDDLVPPSAMAASWRRLPGEVRRAFYPGGYHLLMRDKDRDAVIGDVASWMLEPERALPSGSDVSAAAWTAGSSWDSQVPPWLPGNLDGIVPGG